VTVDVWFEAFCVADCEKVLCVRCFSVCGMAGEVAWVFG
jgi:hypothetical protein